MKQRRVPFHSRILLTTGFSALALGLALPVPAPAWAQSQSRPAQTQSAPSGSSPAMRPTAPPELVIQGDPLMKLLPRDAIASVDDPVMVPAAAGDSFMRDEEMVLGVFSGGQARAYSTWHLDRHEIVNDRLGETPIAATW
jgi:hypothetical protein